MHVLKKSCIFSWYGDATLTALHLANLNPLIIDGATNSQSSIHNYDLGMHLKPCPIFTYIDNLCKTNLFYMNCQSCRIHSHVREMMHVSEILCIFSWYEHVTLIFPCHGNEDMPYMQKVKICGLHCT